MLTLTCFDYNELIQKKKKVKIPYVVWTKPNVKCNKISQTCILDNKWGPPTLIHTN